MEINLLPWRDEILKLNKKIFFRMLFVAVLASVLCIIALYQLFFGQLNDTKSYVVALEEAKIGFIGSIQAHREYKKTHEEMLKRIVILQQLQKSRFDAVRLMNAVSQLVPKGMYLTKLTRKNDEIEINGFANSNLLISSFMKAVDRSPNVKVVSLKHTQGTDTGGAVTEGSVEFVLFLKLTLDAQ